MKNARKMIGTALVTMTLVACGSEGTVQRTSAAVQSAEEVAVLAFLNDSTTTFEMLDSDCALRSNAARNIIDHRNGHDKKAGTKDDNLFDSLDELDAVSQVGPAALEAVKLCADSFGFTPTPEELAVINFLNDSYTDFNRLDIDCSLRSNAAQNLIAHRNGRDGAVNTADDNPFHSLAEVDAVEQVGQAALDLLTACAADFGFGDTPTQDPGVCEPAAWDGSYDQEQYFYAETQLDAELAAKVTELMANAEENRDTSVYFPVRFGEVYQYVTDGAVVHTQVSFVQTIDPEGGIQLWFYYDLDSCLNQTGFWMGI